MTDDGRLVAGRYRLTNRIGSGAMGVVWTARDERLPRTVAVKQLLLQPGLGADAVRLLAERVGAALSASDVVRERVDGVELAVDRA